VSSSGGFVHHPQRFVERESVGQISFLATWPTRIARYQDPRLPRLDNHDQDAATLIDAVHRTLCALRLGTMRLEPKRQSFAGELERPAEVELATEGKDPDSQAAARREADKCES